MTTLAELHAAARDRGIDRYRRLSRTELEAALGDEPPRRAGRPAGRASSGTGPWR